MGKSSKQTTAQNTVAEPWKPAHPLLKMGLQRAEDMFRAGTLTPQPFGPMLAPESPATIAARNAQAAIGMATPNAPAYGAWMRELNPNLYGDLGAVRGQALRSAVPAAASFFEKSGMLNSTPAAEGIAEAATRAVAPIEYGAWGDAKQRQLQGLSMAPAMAELPYFDIGKMGEAGQMGDVRRQMELEDISNLYYAVEDQDYQDLQRVAGLGMGFGGVGGTSSGTSVTKTPSSPLGLIGNILGGVGAIFSDRRLKRDIERIGETPGGVPLYRFRYKGDPSDTLYEGVMAEDVPWAVIKHPMGYDMVDYRKVS